MIIIYYINIDNYKERLDKQAFINQNELNNLDYNIGLDQAIDHLNSMDVIELSEAHLIAITKSEGIEPEELIMEDLETTFYNCECGEMVVTPYNYCPNCGRKLLWRI